MPRKGENIYKRKDSRWEGRYIRGYDISGKAQIGYVYAKSYSEVKEKLLAAKKTDRPNSNSEKQNFAFYCEEWLLLCRSKVKESTYVKYQTIINRHLKATLGEYLPRNLNTVVVEQFSHMLLTDEKLSTKTVRDILTVLKAVLKYIEDRCGNDMMQTIKVIYPRENKREMRVLTVEEQNRLVNELTEDMTHIKFGILLALITGLRIGEICALKWEDIVIDDKVLHVSQTMQRLRITEGNSSQKTRILIGDAKSSSSDRYIPLTDYAIALCRQREIADPEAFVLTGDAKKYMEPRTLHNHLSKICQSCGLKDVHFHTLRHTFATRCVEAGFEVKSLSEILGHSTTKVTLDRYVHSSMELKRNNMDKLSKFEMWQIYKPSKKWSVNRRKR